MHGSACLPGRPSRAPWAAVRWCDLVPLRRSAAGSQWPTGRREGRQSVTDHGVDCRQRGSDPSTSAARTWVGWAVWSRKGRRWVRVVTGRWRRLSSHRPPPLVLTHRERTTTSHGQEDAPDHRRGSVDARADRLQLDGGRPARGADPAVFSPSLLLLVVVCCCLAVAAAACGVAGKTVVVEDASSLLPDDTYVLAELLPAAHRVSHSLEQQTIHRSTRRAITTRNREQKEWLAT